MWHWWYQGREEDDAPGTPGADPAQTGPETTVTWAHLLRESKLPEEIHAAVGSNRWAASRPMADAN